ncbi:hypothetical protein [Zhihengliuella flava]|uniref:Permease n=1 Tax=Zhihengliuella flava TaxID=1285193 RepID=A0A931GFG2_9MICC|nr:hypothetical protein [Zhihengliuella flava]MBG6085353.1 hypothetical protein [Zhihengliuella flava]
MSAAAAVLAAGALAGTVAVALGAAWLGGSYVVAAVVVTLVAVFAYGWPRVLSLPDPWHLTWLIFGAGAAATLAALLTGLPSPMQWMPICLGVGVLGVFGAQLLRGTGAERRLASTMAGLFGLVVATFASGWVGVVGFGPLGASALVTWVGGGAAALATVITLVLARRRLPAGGLTAAIALGAAPILASGTVLYFAQRLILQ